MLHNKTKFQLLKENMARKMRETSKNKLKI